MKGTLALIAMLSIIGCQTTRPTTATSSTAPSPLSALTAPSTSTFKTFAVYSHEPGLKSHYVPSGYMGDSDLTLSASKLKTPQGEDPCLKVHYRASGPKGWSGLYWQDPANNWGERPGKAGYDLRGAQKLSFRARGEKGGERVSEFRVGGIVSGKYPDSDVANLTNIRLTKEWQRFEIDLTGKDLRHIIGGFGFTVSRADNGGAATIFLDDIVYEGPVGQTAASPETAPAAVGRAPVEQVKAPAPVAPPVNTEDLKIKEDETGLKVSFSSRLMFQSGKAVMEGSSGRVLDQLIKLMEAYPKNQVLIDGHTDSLGAKEFNLKLSDLRAKAVRDYLIKNGGYELSRFRVVGYGDTRPIADNKSRVGRSLNRRVEVTILKGGQA